MDIFWIILDSLSFSATPFDDGPSTMPKMSSLVSDSGLLFTDAYVPGPKSPSSHGSFLTGQLPSETGMHEAHPSFDSELSTISDALSDSYRSYLVSSNPFLFNGLDERFDNSTFLNDTRTALFETGSDPEAFKWKRGYSSRYERYKDFVLGGGKPVRSLLNGLYYKIQGVTGEQILIPTQTALDSIKYQSVETMNDRIQSFANTAGDAFVVGNYMDVHPPLNASSEALKRFAPDRSVDDLPIGVSGQRLQELAAEDDEAVYTLYHAAIWDLDRKLTPFIKKLVDDGSFVVITADHGNWFKPDTGLNSEKLHVPLILFGPEINAGTVDKTVNLIQLPATTTDVAGSPQSSQFQLPSLTDTTDSQISVTEYIRAEGGGPVNPYGNDHTLRHDLVGIQESTRVDWSDGMYTTTSNDTQHETEIVAYLDSLHPELNDTEPETIRYEKSTEKRLEELGYL